MGRKTAYDFNTEVNAPITLYAQWTQNPVTTDPDPVTPDPVPVDPTPSAYPVRCSWTGLPANSGNRVPGTRRYAENARVMVDTGYVQGMEVTVDGTTYVFSGWDMEDFRMPSESVTITGVWTEAANIDEENPPLVDTSEDKDPIVPEPPKTDVPDEQPPATGVPDEETPKTGLPDEQPPLRPGNRAAGAFCCVTNFGL